MGLACNRRPADGSWGERSTPVKVALAVASASALGGLCRYALGGVIARRNPSGFPWETFAINISGAFALGILFALVVEQHTAASWLRAALLVGFLGSYTTFSTWTLETWRLVEDGALGLAFANVAASVAVGLAATWLGLVAGRALA
jgi:CrcB protein